MTFRQKDFEIFDKLKFEIQPVGIKCHAIMPEAFKPGGQEYVKQLRKKLGLE